MSKYILKFEGNEMELGEGIYILGRSKDCDIKFQNESVSRRHAKLAIMKDKIFVEDLGSSNGSFINGKLIRGETIVKPEDRLHFGKVVVIIKKVLEEAGETLLCPRCRSQMPSNIKFCMQCGSPLDESLMGLGNGTAEMESKYGKSTIEEPDTREAPEEELHPSGVKKADEILDKSKDYESVQKSIPHPPPPPAPPKKDKFPLVTPDIPKKEFQVQSSDYQQGSVEQRVEIKPLKYEPAGFWIRLLAYFIDSIIISVINSAIFAITLGPYLLFKWQDIFVNQTGMMSPVFWLLIILNFVISFAADLYYLLSGPAKKGATVGKRILKLKIYTMDNKTPIGWKVAFIRLLGYMLSGFILYIGFLMIAFRSDKRGLHDLLANTVVVKEKK